MQSAPQPRCSGTRRTTKASSAVALRGRLACVRVHEPSQGYAIRVRCHASIGSGVTSVATSSHVLFPSFFTKATSVIRSPSRRRLRPLNGLRHLRCSAPRDALPLSRARSTAL
jgi:hypothetical protein